MNIIIGAVVLFWALLGICVFGFVLLNIFKKAHKPLLVLPIFVGLVVVFGISIVSMLYYSTEATNLLTQQTNNASFSKPSSSSSNTLYR